jgi:hypothetical protein
LGGFFSGGFGRYILDNFVKYVEEMVAEKTANKMLKMQGIERVGSV